MARYISLIGILGPDVSRKCVDPLVNNMLDNTINVMRVGLRKNTQGQLSTPGVVSRRKLVSCDNDISVNMTIMA